MYQKILEQIGLSSKEAKVYNALLEHGETTPQTLASETKLNRVTTYAVLKSLAEKELVSQIKKAGKIHYRIEHPSKLEEFIQNQKEKIDQNEKSLASALPSLISNYNLVLQKPGVKYFEGIEGLKKVYLDTLNEKKEILAILTPEEIHPEIHNWLKKIYVKKRTQKGIFAKVIVSSNNPKNEYIKRDKQEFRESLVVSKKYFFGIEMDIYDNKVAFMNYNIREAPIGIIIENKIIAQTMRNFFNLIWDTLSKST
jgi:sugar-specific transcriptional regulator TrmB